MNWHATPAAQAILASIAANPPRQHFIARDRRKRDCEMDFEGHVYFGARVDALGKLHDAAFCAACDAGLGRDEISALLADDVQSLVAATVAGAADVRVAA